MKKKNEGVIHFLELFPNKKRDQNPQLTFCDLSSTFSRIAKTDYRSRIEFKISQGHRSHGIQLTMNFTKRLLGLFDAFSSDEKF